ncbi:damage-control phosphatase ARMT1 [Conger conger]|uniref:damage-control phosphatase ARMT1 n=1 Tax=Conger conger TaxID=82655 RepID=UPI002A5AEB42|nr:damage-control phosphatase ARMT1 [Conger conger]XP_061098327.1 damage-control phosphatase ARMT1 [Conger conger]
MASQEVLRGVPQSLSAKFVGSFAYLTVRDRLPTILTKVIDTIHRNKNKFFEEHGEEGVQAEKRAISFLSKLRNELQTDKPVLALTDDGEDTDVWNQYLQRQQALMDEQEPPSWFKSPWLYVECYMYRRIQESILLNPPICAFDAFREAKTQSYFESQQATMAICTYLQGLNKNRNEFSEEQLLNQFLTLLQVSLWGNKCDLSISAGQENSQKSSPVDALGELKPYILVDDSSSVWSVLTSGAVPGRSAAGRGRVDIVLDNAGFELVTDLVLADFLVSSGLAKQVHFHGKSMPWFVSDATREDFHWTVKQTMAANHRWMSKSGAQWHRYLKDGTWCYHDHPFWTLPHEFSEMAADAPDLYAALQTADLIFFKGDLNYRKLTGDRHWAHAETFARALRGFQPAPLCSLRTLKANVQVGLQPNQGENLTAQEPQWMTSGVYAVIQFSSPLREQ